MTDVSEFLLRKVPWKLTKRKKVLSPAYGFSPLWDIQVPHYLGKVLSLGSKFCLQPKLQPSQLRTLALSVSNKVNEDFRPRCLLECGDALYNLRARRNLPYDLSPTVKFAADSQLRILEAKMEGSFAFMPEAMFQDRADAAVIN